MPNVSTAYAVCAGQAMQNCFSILLLPNAFGRDPSGLFPKIISGHRQ